MGDNDLAVRTAVPKQSLGHSSIQVTLDRYSHLFPSAEAALAGALDTLAAPAGVENVRSIREAR